MSTANENIILQGATLTGSSSLETLTGEVCSLQRLEGSVTYGTNLESNGVVFSNSDFADRYEGASEFTPSLTRDLTLDIEGLLMTTDITIKKVTTSEVANDYGVTFVIG